MKLSMSCTSGHSQKVYEREPPQSCALVSYALWFPGQDADLAFVRQPGQRFASLPKLICAQSSAEGRARIPGKFGPLHGKCE